MKNFNIIYDTTFKQNMPKIAIKDAFCNLINEATASTDGKFDSIFNYMDQKLLSEWEVELKKSSPVITPKMRTSFNGALNRSHGAWYEWIIAIEGWNYSVSQKGYRIFNLPNKDKFFVPRLYQDEYFNYISDFKVKVQKAGVELVTSNPDFVIIDIEKIKLPSVFFNSIKTITPKTLDFLENAYKEFIAKCSFDNIKGYLSAKTTFRSDRLFQMPHEANLMKSLYIHIQTREWLSNASGIKYFALATKFSKTDKINLQTVATHSITSVKDKPEAAVDKLFQANEITDLPEVFDEILS